MGLMHSPRFQSVELPQAIIFDWDNTLVDTWSVIRDALNTTLISFDLSPWSIDETRKRVKKSLRDSFPDLFGNEWGRAAEIFYKRYQEIHTRKLRATDGASELIQKLDSKDIYLSVVSNKRGDILRAEALHLGWVNHFGAIVGANDTSKDKPAREPIDLALSPSRIKPGPNVWFVGDSDIDVECAKNAECSAVLIGTQHTEVTTPRIEADFEFSHCTALSNFIDKL